MLRAMASPTCLSSAARSAATSSDAARSAVTAACSAAACSPAACSASARSCSAATACSTTNLAAVCADLLCTSVERRRFCSSRVSASFAALAALCRGASASALTLWASACAVTHVASACVPACLRLCPFAASFAVARTRGCSEAWPAGGRLAPLGRIVHLEWHQLNTAMTASSMPAIVSSVLDPASAPGLAGTTLSCSK